ncbi:BlaI/MecI/CopY family transcriptional regulator, partial [Clostridioides difficile]|nr:BlaI/MecI/CopY family transcriptional regulator [Clostridioides difficile]
MKEEILIEKLLRAELIVMEYLWKKDTLMPKKEIVKEIKQIYGWHKSTIKILLKRLVAKRYLARYIISSQSHYKIIDSKEYYTFKKKVLKSSK